MAKKQKIKPTQEAAIALPAVEKIEAVGEHRFRVSADLLAVAPENMRHEHVFDPGLAASIKAHGLINPLICRAVTGGDQPLERFLVVDGGRRWTAIAGAIAKGDLPADFMVDIFVKEDAGKEISLAANLHLAAHPLDTCEAILELAKTEDDELRLAAAFGITVKQVQQYIVLAGLTANAKAAYRAARFDGATARLMTRLSAVQQDKLCKGKDRIYDQEVKNTLNGLGVDCSEAEFDWKTLYPADKIQKSLFDDYVILLDRELFKKLQGEAYAAKTKALEAEGYTVTLLERNDYLIKQKFVKYTGEITPEIAKTLTILVRPDYDGLTMTYSAPMMLAKDARKLNKVKGGADTSDTPPKALTAKDMSPAQTEILNGHIVMELRSLALDGEMDEAMQQWIVIASTLGNHCPWIGSDIAGNHKGTTQRWAQMQKEYPGEFDDVALQDDYGETPELTWDAFKGLSGDDRAMHYRKAIAAMLYVPNTKHDPHTGTAEGSTITRIVPGEAFFKRWRTDQLLDYLKRSGTPESKFVPIDAKKSSAVAAAVACAKAAPTPWQFGLDAAQSLAAPKAGKGKGKSKK